MSDQNFKVYSRLEVVRHNEEDENSSNWIIINNHIYDITKFFEQNPDARIKLENFKIGVLADDEMGDSVMHMRQYYHKSENKKPHITDGKLEAELRKFFNFHIFTPGNDSVIVRQELESLLENHKVKSQIPLDLYGSTTKTGDLATIHLLKYIARKHGLPKSLGSTLLSALFSRDKTNIQTKNKFQIALILKYCLTKESNFLSFPQCMDSIATAGAILGSQSSELLDDSGYGVYFWQKIICQLVQSIAVKMESSERNESVASGITRFLPLVDGKTKADILKRLEKWEITTDNLKQDGAGDDGFDIELGAGILNPNMGIMNFGTDILRDVGAKRQQANRWKVQADAVKTQQVMMSTHKQNVSEKSEIQSISLSNALQSGRSRNTERNQESMVAPGMKGGSGSDRSWFSTTGGEITNMHKKASQNQSIPEEDIEWLKNKTSFGFALSNMTVTMYEMGRIAEIFQNVIKYQEIDDKIMSALAHNFFSQQLDSSYENIRLKFLHCFEYYARIRPKGKLPTAMEKTLTTFKNWRICTKDMKRLLWKIFMKNDDNMKETFELSLEQLKNASADVESEICDEALEFIGRQVCVEARARELQESFDYFEQLLDIVQDSDDDYTRSVRLRTAEIIEDYLAWDDEGLTSDWIDKYLDLYTHCDDEDSDWTDESEKTEFQTSLLRSVLRTLDKGTPATAEPSEEMLKTFVQLACQNKNRKLEALIVVTLGNLINRSDSVCIPDFEKLNAKLLSNDHVDENGCIYLEDTSGDGMSRAGPTGLTYISSIVANIMLKSIQLNSHLNFDLSESESSSDQSGNDSDADNSDKESNSDQSQSDNQSNSDQSHSDNQSNSDHLDTDAESHTSETEVTHGLSAVTINNLLAAIQTSPDSMTRILCSECIFEIALRQPLPENAIHILRPLTMDNVVDISIFSTCAYTLTLQNLTTGSPTKTEFEISREDLDLFSKIYAYEGLLTLGEKDYHKYVNGPILEILNCQAETIQFPEEIFQLFTFILSGKLETKMVLKIIRKNIMKFTAQQLLPMYCVEAIEDIFVSEPQLYELTISVLISILNGSGAILADATIEHAHQNFTSQINFCEERSSSFKFLCALNSAQDLPEFMFQDLDFEVIAVRLVTFLQSINPKTTTKFDDFLDQFEVDSKVIDLQATSQNEEGHNYLQCVQTALGAMLEYQGQGRKLSLLNFCVMEVMLSFQICPEEVIQCLIYAAENGQSLTPSLVKSACKHFKPITGDEESEVRGKSQSQKNFDILALASALVHNNQTLPEKFVRHLVDTFCSQTAKGRGIGESDEYDQILFIVAKLAQNSKAQLPRVKNVALHFCNLWRNSSRNSKGRLGVLMAWKGQQKVESPEEKAQQVLRRFCQFWKKSRSLRHRLQILAALKGIVTNSSDSAVNLAQIRNVFRDAVQDRNLQIVETGLQAYMLLDWEEDNDTEADSKMLLALQGDPRLSPKAKENIRQFLSVNREHLPESRQMEFELLEDLPSSSNNEFLRDLKFVLDSPGCEGSSVISLLKNKDVIKRLESILLRKSGAEMDDVQEALEVIAKYSQSVVFPVVILEAVGITMATIKNSKSQEICREIISQLVDAGKDSLISETLIDYLRASTKQAELQLLLKIMDARGRNCPDLKIMLKFQTLLDEEDESEEQVAKNLVALLEKSTPGQLQTAICLDREYLSRFTAFADENLNLVSTCPGIAEIIAANCIRSQSPIENERVARIIENSILSSKPATSPAIYKVYRNLISQDVVFRLKDCFEVLTQLYLKMSRSVRHYAAPMVAILECILEAVNGGNCFSHPFLSFETMQMIVDELHGPVAKFRHLSLLIIISLRENYLTFGSKALEGGDSKIQMPNFDDFTVRIFKEIFLDSDNPDTDVDVDAEIKKNVEFTRELLALIFSLNWCDLRSLSTVRKDRSQWRRLLLISDFIQTFAESEFTKFEMSLHLNKLYKKHGEGDAERIIQLLKDRLWLSSLNPNYKNDEFAILQILSTLNTLSLKNIEKIFHDENVGTSKRTGIDIKMFSLSDTLAQKFSFSVAEEILRRLAERIVDAAGSYEFAHALLHTATQIDDLACLDELIQTLARIPNKKTFLQTIQPQLNARNQMTLQEIRILLESRVLLSELPENPRLLRIKRTFKSLLNNGISTAQIKSFLQLSQLRGGATYLKIFEHVTFQACQYQISADVFAQVISALKSSDLLWNVSDCIATCNKIINNFAFDASSDGGAKTIDKIAAEYAQANGLNADETEKSKKKLKRIARSVSEGKVKSEIYANSKLIHNWSLDDITAWASEVREGHSMSSKKFEEEALMVAKRAFLLTTNFHLTDVQILACLQGGHDSLRKGQLLQAATGSGKSAIIGIIAAIKCLQGHKVDIYTSSSVLAERDAKEWTKFYGLFGLTCDHNADKSNRYISGEKPCYRKDIVYGDCSSFQFDYLRDTYSDLGTLAGRKFSFAIVDEVDSMFIDDSSKLARLSSTLPGMDLLHVMYHLIWDRLTFIKTHLFRLFGSIYYIEGQLKVESMLYAFADPKTQELCKIRNIMEYILAGGNLEAARIYPVADITTFVGDHLKSYALGLISGESISKPPTVKLPKNLKEFAISQLSKWTDSALTAAAFQENVHYIVDDGCVKPVDFQTTGIVQGSTSWNNGLHQFLQIKHGLRLASESVTTNFLSNLAIFQKYESNVIGFTGTLGSEAGKTVLKEVYDVDLQILPETHYKRYVRFPDFIAADEAEWLQEIIITTLEEAAKRRGVLIICETIKVAGLIADTLAKFSAHLKVKVYTKNAENQEKQIERIHPGDVIVATNLAGRGTDIKTADIEDYGGLHVCLTFLPGSLRVEEQAFGRTSRQGKKGTGQLIVIQGQGQKEDLEGHGQDMVARRDAEEEAALSRFQIHELPIIQTKDKLFAQFSTLFQSIREKIREERSIYQMTKDWAKTKVKVRPTPTPFEVIMLQAVEERWAMFLRKLDDGTIQTAHAQKEFFAFEKEITSDLKKDEVIWHGHNLFYYIQLGNHEYRQDSKANKTLDKAKTYFERAIKLDTEFAAGAHAGLAFAYLKGRENLIWFNGHENGYKNEALKSLRAAQPLLHGEMALNTVMQSFVQKQSADGASSALFQQLTEKSNLIGSFLKNIEGTISVIERSLRRVHCAGITSGSKKKKEIGETEEIRIIPEATPRKIPRKHFEKYHLAFHDLTAREDSGVHDQAVETLTLDNRSRARRVASGVKNLLTSKSGPNLTKFPIKLSIAQADLDGIITSSTLWKETFDLDLEIHNVRLADGMGVLDFKFSELKRQLAPDSYSLALLSENAEHLQALLLKSSCDLEKVKIEIHFIPDQSESKDDFYKVMFSLDDDDGDLVKTISRISAEDKPRISGKGQSSVKFTGLKLPADVSKITKIIKTIGFEKYELTLTLNSIDKKSKAFKAVREARLKEKTNPQVAVNKQSESDPNVWDVYLRENFTRISAHFGNLSEDGAKVVIPALREMNAEFVLHCREMTYDTAVHILANADLKQEDISQSALKELIQLFMADQLPLTELRDLSARGICLLVTFNENKFVPWISVATLVALAAVQASAGGLLICTGFGATVGMGLITEGMADLVQAHRAYTTRDFSWSSYATQKAVSLAISAVSMGLSSLKDGAKGVALVAEGAATELTEQAGVLVMTNGKVLNKTIELAGTNLKSLAMKQIAVSTVETGAKIGLRALADGLADFSFEQVREGICRDVSDRVKTNFYSAEFKQMLSFYWALDQGQVKMKIDNIVAATMNPKNSAWLQAWSSVGSPLCNGILSSPQFLGSPYTRITMIYGMISGMAEIAMIVSRVCAEILTKLTDQKPNLVTILQTNCRLAKNKANEIESQLAFKSGSDFDIDVQSKPSSHLAADLKTVQTVFKSLHKAQLGFKMEDNTVSQILKSVSDAITSHIIRIANSHLVSPLMSQAVGSLVAKISADLQDRFLVSDEQNTDEQNANQERVAELKNKPESELTDEDKQFLAANDHKNTFAAQINANAKDYTIAWQKREIVQKSLQSRRDAESATNAEHPSTVTSNPPASKRMADKVDQIVTEKGPADMALMFSMAADNGISLKIVDDPNYVPTQEDIDKGLHIVVYQKGEGGSVGHYSLKDSAGNLVPLKGGPNSMDCGYDVLHHLTGKPVDQLRNEAAQNIQDNPTLFQEIQNTSDWIRDRYPQQANEFLMIGGFRRRQLILDDELITPLGDSAEDEEIRRKCREMLAKPKVQERLSRASDEEIAGFGEGYIYILEVPEEGATEGQKLYKVGLAIEVEPRVGELTSKNEVDYKVVAKIYVNMRFTTESVTHKMLADKKELGPSSQDGYTELFRGDIREIQQAVLTARESINAQYSEIYTNLTDLGREHDDSGTNY